MIPRLQHNWFVCYKRNPAAKARLFCFPYAGGRPQVYRNWAPRLSELVEVWALEAPGRGSRFREDLYTNLDALIHDLSLNFDQYLDKPFAFYGHSLGALLGFELANHLRDRHDVEPLLLIASGRRGPHLPAAEPATYNLPDEEFIKELRRLNGTPKEVLNNPELMGLMLPILKADFQIVQTYSFIRKSPLRCPILALGGIDDVDVPRDSLAAWEEHTTGDFKIRMLPGNHFMIHSAETDVLDMVYRRLFELLKKGREEARDCAAYAD